MTQWHICPIRINNNNNNRGGKHQSSYWSWSPKAKPSKTIHHLPDPITGVNNQNKTWLHNPFTMLIKAHYILQHKRLGDKDKDPRASSRRSKIWRSHPQRSIIHPLQPYASTEPAPRLGLRWEREESKPRIVTKQRVREVSQKAVVSVSNQNIQDKVESPRQGIKNHSRKGTELPA